MHSTTIAPKRGGLHSPAKSLKPLQGSNAPTASTNFENRKRKRNAPNVEGGDIYEYTSSKHHRRAGVKLSLDKDERIGVRTGSNSGGSEDEDDGAGKMDHQAIAKRIANMTEDEAIKIASEDDEEIESDLAFEESDADRFAGFSWLSDRNKKVKKNKSQSKKKQNSKNVTSGSGGVRFAEVNLDEDEFGGLATTEQNAENAADDDGNNEDEDDDGDYLEEEEEGDSDDFIDVLDVLDGRAEPYLRDGDGDEETNGSNGMNKAPGGGRDKKKARLNGNNVQGFEGGKKREGKKARWTKKDRIARGVK